MGLQFFQNASTAVLCESLIGPECISHSFDVVTGEVLWKSLQMEICVGGSMDYGDWTFGAGEPCILTQLSPSLTSWEDMFRKWVFPLFDPDDQFRSPTSSPFVKNKSVVVVV